MYIQTQSAATATIASPKAPRPLVPLDRDGFEHLSEDEAELLLASRFCSFIERGWGWKEALRLAVRPDQATAGGLTRSGDVSLP